MVYTMTCLILFQVGLPTADLDCDLAQYVDLICGKSLDNNCYHIAQYTKKFHVNSKTSVLKITILCMTYCSTDYLTLYILSDFTHADSYS